MSSKQSYSIDGTRFFTLEEFAQHFSEQVLLDHRWNGNLDAFNDILRGGFGAPEEEFTLVWRNSHLSRASDSAMKRPCINWRLGWQVATLRTERQ